MKPSASAPWSRSGPSSTAFRIGVEGTLDTGDFVFLYVGRDLDDRSRRIMTYLAEGPRMNSHGLLQYAIRHLAAPRVDAQRPCLRADMVLG